MSTISEALKKAQRQRQEQPLPSVVFPPELPHDTRRESPKHEPEPTRASGKPSFILILISVAVVAALVFYYLRGSMIPLTGIALVPSVPVDGGTVTNMPHAVDSAVSPLAQATDVVASQAVQPRVDRTDTPVLNGIFYAEKNPVAIINGSAMKEGEMIGAYQVVTIATYSVKLQCEGEKIELRLK